MSDLKKIFSDLSGLTALVIGDVMIDAYSFGEVSRVSPEAPVPVVDIISKDNRLGGAANVAKNIKALGAKCILCSVIGDREDSEEFLRLIEKNQIDGEALIQSSTRKTSIKHRVLSGSKQLLRIDEEDKNPLSKDENNKLLTKLNEFLEKADVVILQDYDKGVLNPDNISIIVEKANKRGVPVVVDPKKVNFLEYKNVSLYKPNLKEINEGIGVNIDAEKMDSLSSGIDKLKSTLQIENVLLTLSEHGVFYSFGEEQKLIPTEAKSISDVSGAGDTVLSVAALLMALEVSPEKIAKLSNLAGGLVCEKLGVVPIDKKELLEKAIAIKL